MNETATNKTPLNGTLKMSSENNTFQRNFICRINHCDYIFSYLFAVSYSTMSSKIVCIVARVFEKKFMFWWGKKRLCALYWTHLYNNENKWCSSNWTVVNHNITIILWSYYRRNSINIIITALSHVFNNKYTNASKKIKVNIDMRLPRVLRKRRPTYYLRIYRMYTAYSYS